MSYYKDLDPCDYFGQQLSKHLRAVAWLEGENPFLKGKCSSEFFAKLCELIQDPWNPSVNVGLHLCTLCQFSGDGIANYNGKPIPAASHECLFVPSNGLIFVSPISIAHYIDSHEYQPPVEFIQAVHNCPPMRSMEYLKALRLNGGSALLKQVQEQK